MPKPSFLLHICCAPCSIYVIELLSKEFEVHCLFYNPNIYPFEEYIKRWEALKNLAEIKKLLQTSVFSNNQFQNTEHHTPRTTYHAPRTRTEWEYENEEWTILTKDFAEEAEGGERCSVCYEFRLEKTAKLAQQKSIPYFGTTLTIGPNKKAQVINETGRKLAQKYNLIFFEADFKKKDGFKISTQLSKELGLYRQNYCGCKYSEKPK